MFYLILSIVASSMLTLVMRHSEGRMKSKTGLLAANYVTCMILAAFFIGPTNLLPSTEGIGPVLGMGAINGFFYMISLVIMQQNIKRNGVGGIVLIALVGVLFFKEKLRKHQWLAMIAVLSSIALLNV